MGSLRRERVEYRACPRLEHSGPDRESGPYLCVHGRPAPLVALPGRLAANERRRAPRTPRFLQARDMKGILLIDHGSTRDEANRMLADMAAIVQRVVGDDVLVRYAHMQLADPTLADGFPQC